MVAARTAASASGASGKVSSSAAASAPLASASTGVGGNLVAASSPEDQIRVAIATKDRISTPGSYIALYYGGYVLKIQNYLDMDVETKCARTPQALNHPPPGDFSAKSAVYFATDRAVAAYYARMARRLDDGNRSVGVLQVFLSTADLAGMVDVGHGDEWKQVRTSTATHSAPN